MDAWVLLGVALLLGVRHALDPDHVVAVSALAAEERRLWPAARLGLVWGIGHLLSIAAVGLPLLIFRLQLPPRFEEAADVGVGALLVLLGAATLWRVVRQRVHFDAHAHDGIFHGHFHRPGHRHPAVRLESRQWVTFGFGVAHGLAGSGAAAVLALQASPDLGAALMWLLLFGLGTVLGMFAMTLMVAAPALAVASRRAWMHAGLRTAAGLVSLCFGGYMILSLLPGWLA